MKMLDKFPGHPIVWVDADARIRQRPVLFNNLKCDFAAHWRSRKYSHGFYPEIELLSGTIYLANNNKTRALMNRWIKTNEKETTKWDQRTLAQVLKGWDGEIQKLPAPYCQIFDSMKNEGGKPVIEHFQLSREGRRNVRI